jgi:hypothetical protein
MRNVALFVEVFEHETFLKAIVHWPADDQHVEIAFQHFSVRGGSRSGMTKRDSTRQRRQNA